MIEALPSAEMYAPMISLFVTLPIQATTATRDVITTNRNKMTTLILNGRTNLPR